MKEFVLLCLVVAVVGFFLDWVAKKTAKSPDEYFPFFGLLGFLAFFLAIGAVVVRAIALVWAAM